MNSMADICTCNQFHPFTQFAAIFAVRIPTYCPMHPLPETSSHVGEPLPRKRKSKGGRVVAHPARVNKDLGW
jgi:hypothetical protein